MSVVRYVPINHLDTSCSYFWALFNNNANQGTTPVIFHKVFHIHDTNFSLLFGTLSVIDHDHGIPIHMCIICIYDSKD